MLSRRVRITLFCVFTAACVAATIGYVRWRVTRTEVVSTEAVLVDQADAAVQARIDQMRASAHLTFLSTRTDAPGHVGLATLDALDGAALLANPECERSHFGKDLGLCLVLNRFAMEPRGYALILDQHFKTLVQFPLAGLPIRARVSHDQRYAVATVFVTGENYSSDFTTRTTLFDLTTKRPLADLEQFTVERDGKRFHEVDFNFWGVTFFQDSNRFLATLGTGGKRLLVEGDIAKRHLTVVGTDVECPSLSPDERHIVFKRQRSVGSGWQLWARDTSGGEAWPISDDAQDIDDQVEWLDNEHVVYARLFGDGAPENSQALWTSPIARTPKFEQQLFLRSAYSPSVIR